MALCDVHELEGDPGTDDRYCVKCGTPEFAITALADCRDDLANLKEDCAPFRSQIDQRKTYKVTTAKDKAANDLFDAVKDEWVE